MRRRPLPFLRPAAVAGRGAGGCRWVPVGAGGCRWVPVGAGGVPVGCRWGAGTGTGAGTGGVPVGCRWSAGGVPMEGA